MATNTRKLASLLGASGAGITDAGTLTSDAIGEVIVASDIAAGAVGSSEIATGAVTATELSSTALASVEHVKPHIQPGMLYPSYVASGTSNKLLDGTTVHSGAFGTAQSDGRSYYYTNIAGSKPIKDPRIGAYFGSQRHTVRSIQLLEQETAAHGVGVYSVDGREWFRFTGGSSSTSSMTNGVDGNALTLRGNGATGQFVEIVGYFNQANALVTWSDSSAARTLIPVINGGSNGTATVQGVGPNALTASGRYVSASSLMNLTFASAITTPGINTLKLTHNNYDTVFGGIELIAQDTTSTANKSKIQIPAQNVVSFGKKFSVSAAAHHYDPFNGFTNGTTLHSAVVDTATSLGLDTGTTYGATWAISGSNNIRPYNGGRVVKWIASDGTIKTSVTMMPPNAQNAGVDASNEITTPSATNTTTTPNMSDDAVESSLSEVAKTFHYREFGNGAANGGNNTSGTWQDLSMLNAEDANGYVMDDGLSSLVIKDCKANGSQRELIGTNTGDKYWITFIGTGISLQVMPSNRPTIVQNLPYGTHVLKIVRGSPNETYTIDGIALSTAFGSYGQLVWSMDFHQPKRPPIPEDAVVIADYMLMADFVPTTITGGTEADRINYISKGVRQCSISRDTYLSETDNGSFTLEQADNYESGFRVQGNNAADSDTTYKYRMPAFATNYLIKGYRCQTQNKLFIDDVDKHSVSTNVNDTHGSWARLTNSEILGVQNWGANTTNATTSYVSAFQFVSPIHTSSHYQSFETPYLHELVGGDRNMEQTNLVVTADGKSWDEVTRKTNYLGPKHIFAIHDTDNQNGSILPLINYLRGGFHSSIQAAQKGFIIAYDNFIAPETGHYGISGYFRYDSPTDEKWFSVNSTVSGSDVNIKATVMYNATNGDGGGITIAGSIFLEKGGSYRMNANADLKGGTNYSNQITLWWLGGRD